MPDTSVSLHWRQPSFLVGFGTHYLKDRANSATQMRRNVPHGHAFLALPGPGLAAHNEAYVASRAAIGKERARWPCFRLVATK